MPRLVFVLSLFVSTTAAYAQESKSAQVEEYAAKAYDLVSRGQYEEAVSLYQKAYDMAPTAALLYNMATIYDKKMQNRQRAAELYRRYIKSEESDAQLAKKAAARLAVFDEEATTKPRHQNSATLALPPPASGPSPVWKWVTLGTGVAVAGVGGLFLGLGLSDYASVTGAPGYNDPNAIIPLTRVQAAQAVNSGGIKKIVGLSLLGAGAALLATSIVLFAVGAPGHQIKTSLLFTGGGAAVTAQGTF